MFLIKLDGGGRWEWRGDGNRKEMGVEVGTGEEGEGRGMRWTGRRKKGDRVLSVTFIM